MELEDMTDSAVERSHHETSHDVVDTATALAPKQQRNVFFRVVSRGNDLVSKISHTIQTGNAELLQGSQSK